MAKQHYYEIVEQSPYHLTVDHLEKMEDASDVFYTEQEIKDLIGGPHPHISTYHPMVRDRKVKAYLNSLKTKMLKGNLTSIIIDDQEFIDAAETALESVSHYVPGLRRTGNKLSFTVKRVRTKFTVRDMQTLVRIGCYTVYDETKITLQLLYAQHHYPSAVGILKKLTTWNSIVKRSGSDYMCKRDKTMLPFMQRLWTDPTLLDKQKKKQETVQKAKDKAAKLKAKKATKSTAKK